MRKVRVPGGWMDKSSPGNYTIRRAAQHFAVDSNANFYKQKR